MTTHRATAEDVARLAGVSQSTVSRAFSNHSRISEATRQRVFAAAARLGYRPNVLARSLITQRSHLIGIVMAGIDTAFAPYVLEHLTGQLQARGYHTILINVGAARTADELLPAALDYQVDGLITTSAIVSEAMAAACARIETPLVLFNRAVPGGTVSSITADNVAGGRLVAAAMARAGVVRPAFITGNPHASTSQDREQGFIEGLRAQGYEAPLRTVGSYTYEAGVQATRDLMGQAAPPDGIFAASDLIAMGVIDTLRHELGQRVPDDVRVVGFDDIPGAARAAYQLSTVRVDFDTMIAATLDVLFRHLESPATPPEQVIVPVQYVARTTL